MLLNPPTSTPILSLPDEILALIFSLVSCIPASFPIFQRDLLSLTHVCARWRHLALTSGELWALLTIFFPITEQELIRAREWIHRSNTYPLTIVIDLRDPDWDFNEESHPVKQFEMQAMMGVILPASERWREVKISADNWGPLHVFLSHTQNISVPLLQSIHLMRCNPYFAAPNQVFVPSILRTPLPLLGGLELDRLTSVELEGVHVDWTSPALRGLTRLSLGYHAKDITPTLTQFQDLLNSCPELESFTLTGWGPRIDETSSPAGELQRFRASITLPHLRNLEIGVMIPTYAVNVLSLLVVPSLESLTIDDISRYDPQTLARPDLGPIFDFLAEQTSSFHSSAISIHHLSTLAVMNLDPGDISLHRFLQSAQNLRVLRIRNCTATTLYALAPSSIGSPSQHLDQLYVEGCDTNVLIHVVSSRKAAIYRSMNVNFQLDANNSQFPLPPDTASQFQQLNIKVIPFNPTKDRQWRGYEVDDSEALVSAILEERWDVAGAVMQ